MPSDTGATWTSGDYTYDGAGNIITIGTPASPGTQGYRTYGYDSLSRLTSAQIGGVTPGATYEYAYDVHGNRIGSTMNQQTTPVSVDGATNRLTNTATYAAAGNQKTLGSTVATWDGFAMMTSYRFDNTAANASTYIYTASDERIGSLRGDEWTWTLRGPDGKPLRQHQSSSTNTLAVWLWVEDFVYRDGALLASEREAAEGGFRHYHLDHLGSARLVTSATGTLLSEHDFLPFGGERTEVGQHTSLGFSREEPLRFTGHERDFENTQPNDSSAYIDYMHARYYGPNTGRFLSVDPVLGSPTRPQSWNRCSYVENNPIGRIDPSGMKMECVTKEDGSEECTVIPDDTSPPAPPLPEPPSLFADLGIFPNADRWLVDNVDHGYARLMNLGSGVSVEECYAAGRCQTLSEAMDMLGPMVGGQYNPAKAAMLGKSADELIRGSLKASASYRAELAQKTYAEIIALSKGSGPLAQATKGMKKRIEQSERLLSKVRGE